MRHLTAIFLLFLLNIVMACNTNTNKSSGIAFDQPWLSLTIIDDHRTVFIIGNNDDSSIVKIRHMGSIFNPPSRKMQIDTVKVYFTRAEKDTLAYLTKELIIHPIEIKSKCTEYVGTVELQISYRQFEQYGMYASTCNWTTLSEKTKHLNLILQSKFKKQVKQ